MEHRITLRSAAKTIACILIVSLLVESIAAAPIADNQQQQQQQQQQANNNKKLNVSLKKLPNNMKRNLHQGQGKLFSQKDYEGWTNPCGASFEGAAGSVTQVDTDVLYNSVKISAKNVEKELSVNNQINTTDLKDWEEFQGRYYEFLPKFPTGNRRKWHFDLQIYVASFGLLHKYQQKEDREAQMFNRTISTELKTIFTEAQNLLCEIEHFVNSTSSQKIGSEDWIKKREMRELLNFQNLTEMMKLHQIYVKGRFQSYIEKLLQRITKQSDNNYVEKSITYPKHKSLALRKKKTVTRRPHKGGRRVNNQNRPQKQKQPLNGDNVEMSTKRVHIVRTTRNGNNNGRRRQRTTKVLTLQQQ